MGLGRVCKHLINTRIVQRSQPINRIALIQLAIWMFVLQLEAFGNRRKAKLFTFGGSSDVVEFQKGKLFHELVISFQAV